MYQDIIQAIRHNNFKRFENIVKKYLTTKEKISKKMMIAIKRIAFGYSDFSNFKKCILIEAGIISINT